MTQIKVKKRNGASENYNVDKIHKILTWATNGLEDVSISDIEIGAKLNLDENTTSENIHKTLIKSANNLTSLDKHNYQYVAARLLSYWLRKCVWGESEPPRLYDLIVKNVKNKIYDDSILSSYTEAEIHKIGKCVKHERDELFTYAGLQQVVDKYLIKNRENGEIYETPQFVYILIPMYLFSKYPKETRLEYIKKAYNYLSTFKLSLPTPILSGVRSKIKQFASCALFDCGDSLDSIFATITAVGKYSAKRAGIGLNIGRIRAKNSYVRGGEIVHTGVLPYTKIFESTVKSTSQNGIRGCSATCHVGWWHDECPDIVPLKNNSGTDDNRIRKLDYSIQLSNVFYDRVIKNEDITLFSPHECGKLYDEFGSDNFNNVYTKLESDGKTKFKRKIKARHLMEEIVKERYETGRIYIMNMDNINKHNPFIDSIYMSNLCQEVLQPTKPINHIDDNDGEIGTCILSAINVLETQITEIESVSDISVRMLEEIIDYQEYPVIAAENFTKNRRSLGIGLTNLASLFAKNKVSYTSNEALQIAHSYMEKVQFYLLKASSNLAKEKGPCAKYQETKYSKGWLPIDTANKEVDKLVELKLDMNWESLRETIRETGLRHSTLTCQMPCESSSVVSNSTNGIEPIRSVVSYKKSKMGTLKQLVPLVKYAKYYTIAWDIKSNQEINNLVSVLQRFIDMGISTNHYYNPNHYEGGNVPYSVITKDILHANKLGIKTLYYANTYDGSDESEENCASGACAI